MKSCIYRTAAPLISKIRKLFSHDLAKENDFLRQKNKILRSKLGKRVPLTETDRRTLVRYSMPIKDRLREIMSGTSRKKLHYLSPPMRVHRSSTE